VEIFDMSMDALRIRRPLKLRLYFLLCLLIVFGVLALVPIAWTALAARPGGSAYVWSLPIILTIAGAVVLIGGLAALGLSLAHRIGFGAPLLEGWSNGQSVWKRVKAMLVPAVLCGLVGVAVILALNAFVFLPYMQLDEGEVSGPPAWQGFLLSIHAGIVEEVVFRLFLLTFLAWLGSKVSATAEGRPTAVVFWMANLLAALLFGAAHLPTVAALGMPLDALVVIRTVTLNGLLGLMFGLLYRRYGIESAMVAHASFDVVVYGLLPLLVG
jgi:membrane protease YdiL (CAAX protease family)